MAANDLTHTNSAASTLDLNDGIVYALIEGYPQGIYALPYDIVTAETPRRRPRGVLLGTQPQARTITIDIMVRGATRSALATNMRALRAHFATDAIAGAMGVLTYTNDNGNERAFAVTPLVNDTQDAKSWLRSGPSARGWGIVTLRMIALDPTCYDPTAVTPSGALSGTNSVNISCANAGDEDAFATITVGAGSTVATNLLITDAYGTWLEFEGTVGAAGVLTLVLDPQNLSMTHSVTGDWTNNRKSGSAIPVIKAGTNNLVFKGDDAGDDGAIAISFNSTYSGHG